MIFLDDLNTAKTETKFEEIIAKYAFITLMNDAFLRSELTKQFYEAKAKDNITQNN